jgi:hypothetical protein
MVGCLHILNSALSEIHMEPGSSIVCIQCIRRITGFEGAKGLNKSEFVLYCPYVVTIARSPPRSAKFFSGVASTRPGTPIFDSPFLSVYLSYVKGAHLLCYTALNSLHNGENNTIPSRPRGLPQRPRKAGVQRIPTMEAKPLNHTRRPGLSAPLLPHRTMR